MYYYNYFDLDDYDHYDYDNYYESVYEDDYDNDYEYYPYSYSCSTFGMFGNCDHLATPTWEESPGLARPDQTRPDSQARSPQAMCPG